MTSDEAHRVIKRCLHRLDTSNKPELRLWKAVIGQTIIDALAKKRRTPIVAGRGIDTSAPEYQAKSQMRHRNSKHNVASEDAVQLIADRWFYGVVPVDIADALTEAVESLYDASNSVRRGVRQMVANVSKAPATRG